MAAEAGTALMENRAGVAVQPVPAPDTEDSDRWKRVLELPCEMTVDLPLPSFKVSDFLNLRPQSVMDAHWRVGHDVPLHLNGTLIGWVEFEVVGNNLAVRLTELA